MSYNKTRSSKKGSKKTATVKQFSFREINYQVCYLASNKNIENVFSRSSCQGNEKPSGALVYGYIDHDAGFTFEFLAWAILTDGKLKVFNEDFFITLSL